MNDWTEGYVSDVEYLPGFYLEQTPAHIDVVCLLQATEPPAQGAGEGQGFRYCELGCGMGETALAIAAANPHGEVWGFDFNPAHIARGNALAGAGGLSNVNLVEASFEELARSERPELGRFDYIALHGVWAWVSEENRAHIVRFINRHLKPGGVAYVTYNALPGWTGTMPLQRLLSMFAGVDHDRSDRRITNAMEIAEAVAKAGSVAVPVELTDRIGKDRSAGNLSYLSHEYLNAHWAPCYQMDVAAQLAQAKLSYVGTANVLENFPDLSLNAEQRQIVARAPRQFAETVKDYFMTRAFRRDIFMRGAREIPDRRLDDRIRAVKLGLVVNREGITRDIKIPLGQATLNESFYAPALEALAQGPRTIGELFDLPEVRKSTANPREVLGMLTGSRQAVALPNTPDRGTIDTVRRYNKAHLAACAEQGRAFCAIAASGSGSAHGVTLFEMLAYEALVAGVPAEEEPLTQAIWTLLESRGDRIRKEGEVVEDRDENIRTIREQMGSVLGSALPVWQRVGAI